MNKITLTTRSGWVQFFLGKEELAVRNAVVFWDWATAADGGPTAVLECLIKVDEVLLDDIPADLIVESRDGKKYRMVEVDDESEAVEEGRRGGDVHADRGGVAEAYSGGDTSVAEGAADKGGGTLQ
jgi:hypothetical protein